MSNSQEVSIDPFKVFIRIRPLLEKEKITNEKSNNKVYSQSKQVKNILVVEDNLLFVLDPISLDYNGKKERSFAFDNVFTEAHSNQIIFEDVIKGMVENVLKGYNATALAYGVTGTGKTHTIFGNLNLYSQTDNIYSEKGVCILALDYLFNLIGFNEHERNYSVKISYLEIYNETVIDLLVTKPTSLMIVEDSVKGVVVPDLSEYAVNTSLDLVNLITQGNDRRTMAATNQNQFSSRSHAILQVVVEQRSKVRDTKEELLSSKFLIVDLAGSERGGLEKGIRTQEGSNINKSLLSLGNCINILSDKSKKGAFVPYRDSKLTRLLKDSLGGNISTVMIACVSPSPMSYDETINTLKYATRARTIEKKITKNVREVDVHISQYRDIIDSLKSEIDQLKEVIKNQQLLINERPTINLEVSGEVAFRNNADSNTPRNNIICKNELSDETKDKEINFNNKPKNSLNSSNNLINCNSLSMQGNINNLISRSTVIANKNGNYSNVSLISRKSAVTSTSNAYKNCARTAQNLNVDDYKKFLANASNYNIENIININANLISPDINNIKSATYNHFPIEDIEKQIDNLQNDKLLLEEFIEKSKIQDKSVIEKYSLIKTFFQKYLELINDKLIENIEQNMILKFNMKEILDLNNTNNQHLSIMYSQLIHLERLSLTTSSEVENEEIKILKNEIKNIQNAIQENESIKDRISESLQKNLKIKKSLKKILMKLISNSSYNNDNLNKDKYEEAYNSLIKVKEELENNNSKYKKYLDEVVKEKQNKDQKLTEVQRELENLKKQLKEKDKKLQDIENYNQNYQQNFINDEENIINTPKSDDENIYLNLQDDYFNDSNKKKFLNESDKSKNLHSELDCVNTSNNIHSIKYIINQTNNIVNNNINKIINKEKGLISNENIPLHTFECEKPPVHVNLNVNRNAQTEIKNEKNIRNSRYSNNLNSQNFSKKKLGSIQYSNIEKDKGRSASKSKTKRNKLKEFDKIIETQLNEVYNRKAKELGDRMKKKIGVPASNGTVSSFNLSNGSRPNNLKIPSNRNSQHINKFNNILDKFTSDGMQSHSLNKSLSISRVSVNQEGDFNSELDIAINIPISKQDFNVGKINSTNHYDRCSNINLEIHKSSNNLINLQKFLNERNSANSKMQLQSLETINPPNYINTIIYKNPSYKEKPVMITTHKRDYSAGCNQLRQARLEQKMKNRNLLSKSNISGIPSSDNSRSQNVNKNISKNVVEFLNDYSNRKSTKMENSDNNLLVSNRTVLRKSEVLDAALSSLINGNRYDENEEPDRLDESNLMDIDDEDRNKEKDGKEIDTNMITKSAEDLFKNLNNAIKNQKVTKYLDKK